MAHFAELDENNFVQRVIVVANHDCLDEHGQESEAVGQAYCHNLLGGRWVQTSYNANFRYRYAGIGYVYDQQRDAFIYPQPYPSWHLNEITCGWEAPTPRPDDGKDYIWNESTLSWVELIL